MKHLFFALCILTATSAFTLVACSKKDGLLKDETHAVINHTNRGPVRDTPYGKIITPIPQSRTALDTPYGRYSSQAVNAHSIKSSISIVKFCSGTTCPAVLPFPHPLGIWLSQTAL
jgi:hypothetical protein